MATARTKLIYQQQQDLRHHLSKVISISPISALPVRDQSLLKNASEDDYALITDETIFYVQGGGQPSDTGTITTTTSSSSSESEPKTPAEITFEVSAVRHPASGGAILHFGRFNPPLGQPAFKIGDEIQQYIDSQKRDLYSRLHTAGHVLGLAINALMQSGVLPPLTESKASHYPDSAAVEFIGLIESKHLASIQAKTDEFVGSKRKVLIHWWPMERLRRECLGVGDEFELPEGETEGRVVEMDGLGAYPCGGTHVGDCGEVGRVEVRKIARSKGVSRVSYRVA